MNQRVDGGEILQDGLQPPKPTGRRSTITMQVDILVEVYETDSWNDMVSQAQEEVRKRVKEGKGFFPFRSKADMIYDGQNVDYLIQRLSINPRRSL